MKAAPIVRFRLYVTGDGPNSSLAVANLKALCQAHLAKRHQIEIIDLLLHPDRALEDQVMLTPTLVKLSPRPVRRVIGNLSQEATVLQACGLTVSR
ncbi:MAG: circadian clock KaiB family protein [Acidobacteriota bacterium]|nr:circadian clock KaiB family protein [Acidobacteriota bacterium]